MYFCIFIPSAVSNLGHRDAQKLEAITDSKFRETYRIESDHLYYLRFTSIISFLIESS